jgi:hypothetical protein
MNHAKIEQRHRGFSTFFSTNVSYKQTVLFIATFVSKNCLSMWVASCLFLVSWDEAGHGSRNS